jgi:hypothetical protein
VRRGLYPGEPKSEKEKTDTEISLCSEKREEWLGLGLGGVDDGLGKM